MMLNSLEDRDDFDRLDVNVYQHIPSGWFLVRYRERCWYVMTDTQDVLSGTFANKHVTTAADNLVAEVERRAAEAAEAATAAAERRARLSAKLDAALAKQAARENRHLRVA